MTTATRPTTSTQLVDEARNRVARMDPAEAELAASLGATFIDVREASERERDGYIPGSLHVPRGMLEFHADVRGPSYMAELDSWAPLITYCGDGARGALAADALKQLGYRQVSYLDGGLGAWKAANMRIEAPR